jgi:hypothetical protein
MATVERIVASPERGISASRRVSEEGPFDEMASVPKLGRSLFPSPTVLRKPPHQMSKASTVQLQTQRGLTRSESYGQPRSKSERHSGKVKRTETFPLAMKRSALARAVSEATDELTPKVLSYENEKVPGTPEETPSLINESISGEGAVMQQGFPFLMPDDPMLATEEIEVALLAPTLPTSTDPPKQHGLSRSKS